MKLAVDIEHKMMADSGEEIRDIGVNNVFSMKGGLVCRTKSEVLQMCTLVFFTEWHYNYKIQPRKNKVHRSMHNLLIFGGSVYLPYRYSDHVNTMVYSLAGNRKWGKYLKTPSKVLIYGVSVLIGQMTARLYWVFKRSSNATKVAVLNAYLAYKTYNIDHEYEEKEVFEEVRPKMVS